MNTGNAVIISENRIMVQSIGSELLKQCMVLRMQDSIVMKDINNGVIYTGLKF